MFRSMLIFQKIVINLKLSHCSILMISLSIKINVTVDVNILEEVFLNIRWF
jgi:hypothetical protein